MENCLFQGLIFSWLTTILVPFLVQVVRGDINQQHKIIFNNLLGLLKKIFINMALLVYAVTGGI